MRKTRLWSILLIATVLVGTSVLFAVGRQVGRSSSPDVPAVPLPPATPVAGGTAPVRAIPGRPTRIRVELDSTAPTATISFGVRSSGDGNTPTELADHALPWAAELDAPGGADYLSVTGYVADRGTLHQVRCRIIVGGVVVETKQRASYASCTFSLRDLGG